MKLKYIVMLGSARTTEHRGGIWSVTEVYREHGLFDRWPITYLGTVTSGNRRAKLHIALSALLYFVFLLATGQVSLLHAHTASRASFWRKSIFMLLAYFARRPFIFHLHGAEFKKFYEEECGRIAKSYVRFVLDRATRIVVLSSQWETIVSHISTNQHIVRIFNPVSINSFPDFAHRKHGHVLLFLGRLGRRKGIFDLLKALVELKRDFPDIKLECGGDGDLEGVAVEARHLGISNSVNVLGFVAGGHKQSLLTKSNVYVLPSYDEGLPMGILEAMAAGLPVVSTPVGGVPDAVEDGVEGYLVPVGDIKALTRALRELLLDPKLRFRMGLAGRKKVERQFTPEHVLPSIEALYRELGANSVATTSSRCS